MASATIAIVIILILIGLLCFSIWGNATWKKYVVAPLTNSGCACVEDLTMTAGRRIAAQRLALWFNDQPQAQWRYENCPRYVQEYIPHAHFIKARMFALDEQARGVRISDEGIEDAIS